MVLLHVKKGDESQFLFETTVQVKTDELIRDLCSIYNGRLKIQRICYEIEELAKNGTYLPENMIGLTDDQIEELKLVDEWSDICIPSGGFTQVKDPIGSRNGKQPNEKMQDVLNRTIGEVKAAISNKQVDGGICMTESLIKEQIDTLRGAVTIVYPMNLPPHDPIRMEFENCEELSGKHESLNVINESAAELWFCGKQIFPGKKLMDFIGKNEKTKVIIKIQRKGQGPPGREPIVSEEEKKKMMQFAYKKQEELKVIDPAFTTILMEFDSDPAECVTISNVAIEGLSNCSVNGWTSCREGCTRDIYICNQIRVNYRLTDKHSETSGVRWDDPNTHNNNNKDQASSNNKHNKNNNNGPHSAHHHHSSSLEGGGVVDSDKNSKKRKHKYPGNSEGEMARRKGWLYQGAHLYPNVKGCGYPPAVICSEFLEFYGRIGRNFSCYYSKIDPALVVTTFDMTRVILDLVYSMAIPIPSFIISCIYLTFAYFKIYNTPAPDPAASETANQQSSPTNNNNISTTNLGEGGGGGGGGGDQETSLCSIADEMTQILTRSSSRGLNALTDKILIPNSSRAPNYERGSIEMNDLGPPSSTQPPPPLPDGQLIPRTRNNRIPDRNGPTNNNNPATAAKNKGGEPTLLGFEETDF